MKYSYILISSEEDFLVEQAFISIHTLKRTNPEAHATVLLDTATYSSLSGDRSRIKALVDEFITVDMPKEMPPMQRSRYLKTKLRKQISGDFLYIDCDTLITGDLSELEDKDIQIGAVRNRHETLWNEQNQPLQFVEYYKKTGKKLKTDSQSADYFNGGVIFCRDTADTHRFFEKWHELWRESSQAGFYQDQVDMWRANVLCGNIIIPIEGIFNCQIIYLRESLRHLFDVRILHYFVSSESGGFLKIRQKDFLAKIREEGITEEVEQYLDNFKTEYIKSLRILRSNEVEVYDAPLVVLARKLYRDMPFLNRMVRKGYHLLGFKDM